MRPSRRQLALAAFLVLVLAGEVAGRWLVANLSLSGHAPERQHGGFDPGPALAIVAKVALVLVLARLSWRLLKAHRVARAGERLFRVGAPSRPWPTVGLSPRAWAASFLAMSVLYLVPTSSDEWTSGSWPVVSSWLHTQALPVFAVLAVVVAVLWRTISRWLAALEEYGETLREVLRAARPTLVARRPSRFAVRSPRALHGLAFQSRPPPLPA